MARQHGDQLGFQVWVPAASDNCLMFFLYFYCIYVNGIFKEIFLLYLYGRRFITVSLKPGRFMLHQHIVFFFSTPPTLSLMAMSVGSNAAVFRHKEE